MPGQIVLWRLPSGAVSDDESLVQRRRGYWLRLARERAGFTLSAAAEAAGLSAGSGSTVTRWEQGERPIKVIHLERLARAYRVPVSSLMRPERTDDERLDEAIAAASDAEREDWAEERPQRLGAAAAPVDERRRRSA